MPSIYSAPLVTTPFNQSNKNDYIKNSTRSHYDIVRSFKNEMINVGIKINAEIIADGDLHRAHIIGDKPSSRNCWYVLHLDGLPCGVFGNWKSGGVYKWCAKSAEEITPSERAEQLRKTKQLQQKREQAKREEQLKASERAAQIWQAAVSANPQHPYLQNKQISAWCARQRGNCIVLPITDLDGKIWSVQFIYPDGFKTLLTGGAKKTHFISINGFSNTSQFLLCEGFATGSTLAETYPDFAVIAAIDVGNLESVAVLVRQRFSKSKIIVCADDDRETIENPGMTKGRKAAIFASALFTSPQFPDDAPQSLTDFNDLACFLKNKKEAV